jgi:SAM-dependent methyltransferase
MRFLRREIHPEEVEGREVLEIGSQNVNGTPRTIFEPLKPARYVGVDCSPGDGVDLVIDASEVIDHFGLERFDIVVSTEMLEHAKDWRAAVYAMKRVLRPRGLLVVTTRSPGFPYHGYPYDFWRFTLDDFRLIFRDMDIITLEPDDPAMPGVLLKAMKPEAILSFVDLSTIEVHGVAS